MASIKIEVGSGNLLVYKGKEFDFKFQISDLIPDSSDICTIQQEYKTTTIDDRVEYSSIINMIYWNNIIEIEETDDECFINIKGIPNLKYQYKVEFLNIDGSVMQLIKNYDCEYDSNESFSETISSNLITTSVNSYKLKITVKLSNDKEFYATKEVILYNTPPTIIAKIENNKLFYTIGDVENDLIKYTIKLNHEKIYPEDEDVTDFQKPLTSSLQIDTTKIRLQEVNIINIDVEDSYGEKNSFVYEFVGDYFGLLFTDEDGRYYSTDLGKIMKRLNLGKVKAGSLSDIKSVNILNKTGVDLNLINVNIKTNKLLTVFYGFSKDNLIPHSEKLVFNGKLKNGSNVKLYLQVSPNLEFIGDAGTSKAIFEIDIIAPQSV